MPAEAGFTCVSDWAAPTPAKSKAATPSGLTVMVLTVGTAVLAANCSTPVLTTVPPPYVLVPLRMVTPLPFCCSAPAPLTLKRLLSASDAMFKAPPLIVVAPP